jgi:hypothetical protein
MLAHRSFLTGPCKPWTLSLLGTRGPDSPCAFLTLLLFGGGMAFCSAHSLIDFLALTSSASKES